MLNEERTFEWKAVVWAAILIFVLSILLMQLVPVVYGTYIGFQTRGDTELINEGVAGLVRSPFFIAYVYLSLAIVAWWRGAVLAGKVIDRIGLHVGIAAGLAVLAALALELVLSDSGPEIVDFLLRVVATFGGAYLGAFLVSRKTDTVTA